MSPLAVFMTLVAFAPSAQDQIEATVAECIREVDAERLRRTVHDLVGFGTRHVLSATGDEARGTGAARSYLERRFQELVPSSGGRLEVARRSYGVNAARRGIPRDLEVVNVVATLRGVSDPERFYVVGGHYDSRNSSGGDGEGDAPGANDDGSGTAAVVEACRVLATREFAATILFVCYDGEEQGLLGSRAHAAELRAVDALVDGMITNDIVGNTLGMDGVRRQGYLRCFSYAARDNDSVGRSLARAVTRAARHVPGIEVRMVFRGDRYGRGGDHRPFDEQGYPAVRFTEPREDYSRQHQDVTTRDGKPYGDVAEFVDFEYLAQVTRVNVALLAELASAPRPPAAPLRVRGARDRYDTIVDFAAVEGVDTYEAVWRDTTAPDWTGSAIYARDRLTETRRGLQLVLKDVCLDDVVVGVRSIGADGSRSRVTTPSERDAVGSRGVRAGRRGR